MPTTIPNLEGAILEILPVQEDVKSLPDPFEIINYNDLSERQIWLEDEISWASVSPIIRYIQHLNRTTEEYEKPITLHIASPGGDLDSMFALYHTIVTSKISVNTVNEGGAHSAAFIIFLAGKERRMNPYLTFIAHEGSGRQAGSYRETKAAMKQYDKDIENMKAIIVSRTKYSMDELSEKFEREQDLYIDYQTALEKGVITNE